MEKEEFTFFGFQMEMVSVIYGLALIFWAIIVSLLSESRSITSWIPGAIGFPILLFGFLTIVKPSKKKLFMHIVASFGVLAFLGGMDFLRGVSSSLGYFSNPYADSSKLMLLLSGAFFSYLCLRSFIFSRKLKKTDIFFS